MINLRDRLYLLIVTIMRINFMACKRLESKQKEETEKMEADKEE